MADLRKEFEFYLANQDALVKEYRGKVIVIKDQRVIGQYESETEAISETTHEHELGTFLVQRCLPGDEETTQTFHTRVVFA